MRGLKLEFLGSLYCDAAPWKRAAQWDKDDAADDQSTFELDAESFRRYNAEDSLRTAQIAKSMATEPDWSTPRVQNLYAQSYACSQIAAEMHLRGFGFDSVRRAEYSQSLTWEYMERLHHVREAAHAVAPGKKLRVSSKDGKLPSLKDTDFRDLLYKEAGIPCAAHTPSGLQSVNRNDVLRLFLDPRCTPEIKKLCYAWWAASSVAKAKSTFVDSEDIDVALWSDGRVHPMWNSCGADTGRWSCRRPSIQVLAESKSEGDGDITGTLPNFRALYRAAPGKLLVHADWSQLELRIFVAVAGDTVLKADLESGDAHAAAARAWFGETVCPPGSAVAKSVRRTAKEVNFSGLYGALAPTIQTRLFRRQIFLPERQVNAMRQAMLTRRPAMERYWRDEMARVCAAGYTSETRLDRRQRRYPERPGIPEIANYPIQGTAADLANRCLIKLDGELKRLFQGAAIVTYFHDAFDVECQPRDGPGVRALMEDVMQAPVEIGGQYWCFPVDVKIGERWSDV